MVEDSSLPKSTTHDVFTHMPADTKGCEICAQAKMRNKRKIAGASTRVYSQFGDCITCDHKFHDDRQTFPGVGGFSYALNVLDAATKYRMSFPLKSLTSKETAYAIQYFRGDQRVKSLYSDKAPNIEEACKSLDKPWEHSLPGVPQTNGKIEKG